MRTFKVRAFASVATALAVTVAVGLVFNSGQMAQAQTVPTKGQAPTASGGQAWTRLIGDLKKFSTPTAGPCGSAWAGYVVCEGDYDDDLGSSSAFVVSPNPGDDPLQHAWKVLYFDFHDQECTTDCPATNDIQAIQKEIFWLTPDESQEAGGPDENAAGQRVLHHVVEARLANGAVNPEVIMTGNTCNVIGVPGQNGTIADGLVQTGQVSADAINDMIAKCIQNEGGFHLNNWTISKHLPPGVYAQCVTLLHTNGAETDRVCVRFLINPVDHYVIDFGETGVAWSGLRANNKSVHSGDFDLETADKPTIQGDGNTSLVYGVAYTQLKNAEGKTIWQYFDGQINRKKNAGTPPQIVEFQHIDDIVAPTNNTFSPTVWFEGPTTLTPAALGGTSGAVCLEPNEPLKLDFSVTPAQSVFSGTYQGQILVTAARDPEICTASLDQGESPEGDPNVFDNNPSQGGPGVWPGPFFVEATATPTATASPTVAPTP